MGKVKIASLFCGIGGTDLGLSGGFTYLGKKFDKLPTELIYANDNYSQTAEIFEKNFEVSCDKRDVREIKENEIPEHDILTGGFPCQSFSIVAQNPPRLGYKSKNGKLFFEMIRILREKQPKAFIAENVKGILSANKGKAFPLIIEEFEKVGYDVTSGLVNAADYGIPQKRERVFIVGFRKDLRVTPKIAEPPRKTRKVALKKVIFDHKKVDGKYYFSAKAVRGLSKSNPKMNKGRVQNPEEPCATVTSHLAKVSLNSTDPVLKTNGRYRRFTPREVARIQSFPESFKLDVSDSHQYKALGNAIPPVLMWHIGKPIIDTLTRTKSRVTKIKKHSSKL